MATARATAAAIAEVAAIAAAAIAVAAIAAAAITAAAIAAAVFETLYNMYFFFVFLKGRMGRDRGGDNSPRTARVPEARFARLLHPRTSVFTSYELASLAPHQKSVRGELSPALSRPMRLSLWPCLNSLWARILYIQYSGLFFFFFFLGKTHFFINNVTWKLTLQCDGIQP